MPKYLTCHDYGQGGVWLYIEADSLSAITEKYRELTVFEAPPQWWTEEYENLARRHQSSDPFWSN